jgi:hypothetical protein
MDGDNHIPDDQWISASPNLPMSTLTGLRPEGDVFTGSLPYVMIEAIMRDAADDVKAQLEADAGGMTTINGLAHRLTLAAVIQTSRRLALEFKGCTIDPDLARPGRPD